MMAVVLTILARVNVLEYQNECIIEKPKIFIYGSMERLDGFWTPGPNKYHLYYKGKTRNGHSECEVKVVVTECEYERRMYEDTE